MSDSSTLAVLWRRRLVVLLIFVVFVGVAAVISKVLPKVYSASSTLIVVQNENAASFDAAQAAQVTARSYSDIVSAPVVASMAASQLGHGVTRSAVSSAVSVSPVSETQLLRITAESRNPALAQRLANVYAGVVIEYTHRYLGTSAGATVALASPAVTPTAPARPRPTLYIFVAAILGLFVGVGGAFLLERLDTRLRTVDKVRSRFKQVVLTRVPRRGTSRLSQNAFEEAFGLLRTNLQFTSPSGAPKVIAVTSAREGEGKTTCVSSMAFAMGDAGSRVIVVDADFRRSHLQAEVMPDAVAPLLPGFSDYLLDVASVDDIVYETGRTGVQLVPTGTLPSNPAAFLESHAVKPGLRELAARSDVVLVDCPPLSAGADASILAARVDGVIVVINLASSDEGVVSELLRQLELVRAPVLGFVLNEDRATELSYYYEYSGQPSA
jgi:capsular exopolysaccharide synthesis family protein